MVGVPVSANGLSKRAILGYDDDDDDEDNISNEDTTIVVDV